MTNITPEKHLQKTSKKGNYPSQKVLKAKSITTKNI
jgi:hypothetical protein